MQALCSNTERKRGMIALNDHRLEAGGMFLPQVRQYLGIWPR